MVEDEQPVLALDVDENALPAARTDELPVPCRS
jgi:hypothetical protein